MYLMVFFHRLHLANPYSEFLLVAHLGSLFGYYFLLEDREKFQRLRHLEGDMMQLCRNIELCCCFTVFY